MTARRKTPPEPTPVDRDAAELGHLVKQGGFRLGLLCARCVLVGAHGGDRSSSHVDLPGKVSVAEFAAKSGVSESKIRLYYRAWELAAETGICGRPSELVPGDEDDANIGLWEDTEDDDQYREKWSYWLGKARKPKKEQTQDDSIDENESPTPPNLVAVPDDEEDESDSVDEDFGLPAEDESTEDELAEADTEIQAEKLRDILESIRAKIDSVSNVVEVLGDNEQLLSQIVSAASELQVVAQAMIDKAEKAA